MERSEKQKREMEKSLVEIIILNQNLFTNFSKPGTFVCLLILLVGNDFLKGPIIIVSLLHSLMPVVRVKPNVQLILSTGRQ